MNTSGLVMVLVGVVMIAQIARGGALQRLGIMACPAGSGNPKKGSQAGSA